MTILSSDKRRHRKKKYSPAEYITLGVFLVFCLVALSTSIVILFVLPVIFGEDAYVSSIDSLNKSADFRIRISDGIKQPVVPEYSPHTVPLIVETPPLVLGDSISIIATDGNTVISETDCMEMYADHENYISATSLECHAVVPYNYASESSIELRALLEPVYGESLVTPPISITYDWKEYENEFWGFTIVLISFIIPGFVLVVLPLSAGMYYLASRHDHHIIYHGEYTLKSLLYPFKHVKNMSEWLQAFIASPFFWMVEIAGFIAFVTYLAITADAFKSAQALVAFLTSGGIAFFVPFLWVAVWWFADYKEREPLRIIVSLFLWGILASLMAIGLNTLIDSVLLAIGIGALSIAILIPIVEEILKGAGLVLFSLHHEYGDVTDGIVFGFTIGMGFAFVENWLYLLDNPMGADISSWLWLFFLRSVMFSAGHGVYTALTGGIIGYLKKRRHSQILYAFPAMIPAVFLHAVHNSAELMVELFGEIIGVAYCCIIMPLFDYGGLFFIALLMLAWLSLKKRKKASGGN